ncbi:DUF3710 domain-containing protein [Corynebacterium sp. sy039]|uniref:DUF3710 domain-containing protein n=1 Tax=Corynebacterium sp. sy039 TaxID=2599641 RepID=UPI0011B3A211|nr:DUF3710 domain-containing protein [Corynebacterium sp. sy039]QDZ42725.1 DUF3710 domain-containing protein [Corynebacterium sp. sy039]
MALWRFFKDKNQEKTDNHPDAHSERTTKNHPESLTDSAESQPQEGTSTSDAVTAAENTERKDKADADIQNVQETAEQTFHLGAEGPFDGDSMKYEDFDFSDFGGHALNLGSMVITLPQDAEVQVEMNDQGPKMLHILTPYGRLTPAAFAAPTSGGQWRKAAKEIAEGMRNDGLTAQIHMGPWGREVVGRAADAKGVVRVIGVEKSRWMLRITVACPVEYESEMVELAREVIARTFVYRGSQPIMAGEPLPVGLPEALAQQVQAELKRRQANHNQAQENT